MIATHAQDVEGFIYHNPGHKMNGRIVQIVGQVRDARLPDNDNVHFFVRFPSSEVAVATGSILSPWFPL